MALQQWAVPQLSKLLSLDEDSSKQIVSYTEPLSNSEAAEHLRNLLGDSPEAIEFITSFNTIRSIPGTTSTSLSNGSKSNSNNPFLHEQDKKVQSAGTEAIPPETSRDVKTSASKVVPDDGMTTMDFPRDTKAPTQTNNPSNPPDYHAGSSTQTQTAIQGAAASNSATHTSGGFAPPPHPPPSNQMSTGLNSNQTNGSFAPPAHPPPSHQVSAALRRPPHTNPVIEAAQIRAKDEQEMQNLLLSVQMKYGIYNSDIEPEHDTDYYCNCPIHNYQRRKWNRIGVQDRWSRAVMYPGEKSYNDDFRMTAFFSSNPYRYGVVSPYGYNNSGWYQARPQPGYHATSVRQTIQLNAKLNAEAQRNVDAKEPKVSIWQIDEVEEPSSSKAMNDVKQPRGEKNRPVEKESTVDKQFPVEKQSSSQYPDEKGSGAKRRSMFGSRTSNSADAPYTSTTKTSKLTGLMKVMGVATPEEKAAARTGKMTKQINQLRDSILKEEDGRWPDQAWRNIVTVYQEKIGMSKKVADLRARQPLQYFHLLRAGYFEPIPVAWANLASNPLKFSIESAAGWRGITPAWRGFEDTAEERLYWVLNHREGSVGMRLKPDFISEMNMARARMETAVEPPPEYFSAIDTCHLQHTSAGYSRQVMPSPFRPFDRPETPTDDTMILLDVSGSMDFDPLRPVYDQYMITGYTKSTQPKNKDVAKAIIRRFTDAMANHDHAFNGYDLITFSSQANYIGSITHKNLDSMWRKVRIGGGTRVMTGWQQVKEQHFQKHSESATHHPVYGWQAGPETPMLRLLLLLDGEATDMDEFELDLLGLSWAHVTIFLIGVDGCPHHHRHANELQRISDVNHHVSFVDAQGNTPERFVTHELLKRHLGYDISMSEFQQMEELPAYSG